MKNVGLSQAKGQEIGAKITSCFGTLSTIDDEKLFQVSPHYAFLNSVHKLLLVLNKVPLPIRGDFHFCLISFCIHTHNCATVDAI